MGFLSRGYCCIPLELGGGQQRGIEPRPCLLSGSPLQWSLKSIKVHRYYSGRREDGHKCGMVKIIGDNPSLGHPHLRALHSLLLLQ